MLKAFIDDSGSGGDSAHYVLAGYMGTVDGWSLFDQGWLDVLHAAPYIQYFKSSEAESLRPDGQWKGVTKDQRNAKIDALIKVIGACTRRSVCARMRQKDYDDIVKGNVPTMWDSPYYILFTTIVTACINIERLDGDFEEVDFVFDQDEQHKRQFSLMLPPVSRMDSLYGKFVGAVRKDDQEFLPLQAADLLAWQTRRFLEPNGEFPRPHFYAARDCPPEQHHLFIMDRPKLAEMMHELSPSLGRLQAPQKRQGDFQGDQRSISRAGVAKGE